MFGSPVTVAIESIKLGHLGGGSLLSEKPSLRIFIQSNLSVVNTLGNWKEKKVIRE